MKPRRAISLVPVMTCVEIASERVMEEVQSQASYGNASHEAEESSSGSKVEVSRGSLYAAFVYQGGLNLVMLERTF